MSLQRIIEERLVIKFPIGNLFLSCLLGLKAFGYMTPRACVNAPVHKVLRFTARYLRTAHLRDTKYGTKFVVMHSEAGGDHRVLLLMSLYHMYYFNYTLSQIAMRTNQYNKRQPGDYSFERFLKSVISCKLEHYHCLIVITTKSVLCHRKSFLC